MAARRLSWSKVVSLARYRSTLHKKQNRYLLMDRGHLSGLVSMALAARESKPNSRT